ncbi:MAG: hypothetical protein RIB60_06580 [Phycisphaerales bacterium]
MSDRVCYMARDDRGGRLASLRLVGAHSDDAWAAPNAAASDQICADGADWVRSTLAMTSKARTISTLCLDPDGSVCSWVSSPTGDPELVRATIESTRGTTAEMDAGGYESGSHGRFPDLPGETSYEPLADREAPGSQRLAVLAVPEVPARMLIDELDARGVRVGRAVSLWHAAAQAWDPSGPGAASNGSAIAEHAPATAVVLIDPDAPRIVWCWSVRGALVAGGTIRLRSEHRDDETLPVVTRSSIGRLASEWLSWSVQLGVAPDRIVTVGSVDAHAEDGLSIAKVGDAIGSNWPGASVAVIDDDDPIGTTLRRLVAAEDLGRSTPADAGAARSGLTALTGRPTRAHRSMHVWAALALVVGAIGIGAAAYKVWDDGRSLDDAIAAAESDRREAINAIDPGLFNEFNPMDALRQRVSAEQAALNQTGAFPRPKPVLEQLETMTLVLGVPGIELDSIDLSSLLSVQATVRVDDIALAEQLGQSLRGVAGDHVVWQPFTTRPDRRTGKMSVTFQGIWRESAGVSP